MGGFTCRHDITPRSACKFCLAEDARMRRASERSTQAPKPKRATAKERHARLIEENKHLLAEQEKQSPTT